MTITETIQADTKTAMRERDELTLSVLRMLAATIHNREIEKRAKAGEEALLEDDELTSAIRAELKKRTDAALAYEGAGRAEAATRERAEAEILKKYLPEEMPDAELAIIVQEGKDSTGVTSMKESGKLMGFVMQRVKGRASGDRVRAEVERLLGSA